MRGSAGPAADAPGARPFQLQFSTAWLAVPALLASSSASHPTVSAMAPPLLWFLSAAGLLLLSLSGVDNDGLLLVAGLCGLLLSLVVIALPWLPPLVQVLVFVALVVGGYALLRHWARRQRERPVAVSAAAERAEVISGFDRDSQGRVRWQGQSWAAVNLAPETALPAGTEVMVMGRDGTCLQVLPRRNSDASVLGEG